MAILLKACPRCGGDIDTTFGDDVYCIQCAYRPTVHFPIATARAHVGGKSAAPAVRETPSGTPGGNVVTCPKCKSSRTLQLERARPNDNACHRCRACGHIFSPDVQAAAGGPEAAIR